MGLTPAEKQAAYRARKRAAKAQAALPSPEQIKERDEAADKVEQLSRAAGVPRNYPQSVWKRAAGALLEGEGRIQGKVKALRSLCAVDKEWRKRVADWVRADQSEASKKYIAAQGWTLAESKSGLPAGHEFVLAIEKRIAETGETIDQAIAALEPDFPIQSEPDPTWAALVAELEDRGKRTVTNLCDQCGGPVTRQIGHAWYCDRHDGTPTRPQLEAPAFPASPAQYINADFGKAPTQSRLDLARQGQADFQAANARAQRADFGPVDPESSVFVNCRLDSPKPDTENR